MAKVFNVEQLRLNNKLLTGNSGGELFYDGVKLAAGSTAVPLTRTITFGDGIRFLDGATNFATRDLSTNRTINLQVDDTTIGFNSETIRNSSLKTILSISIKLLRVSPVQV